MNKFKKLTYAIAAALVMSTISAIPTNAAVNATTLTINTSSSSVVAGDSATAVVSLSFLAQDSADTVTVTSYMISLPPTAAKLATLSVSETSSARVSFGTGNYSADVSSTTNIPTYVTAKLLLTLDAPSVVGDYVVRVLPTLKSATGAVTSLPVDWTVHVTARDITPAAATTTSILNSGEVTTATTDAIVYAPKASSSDAAAVIVVTPKNAIGASATESILATVTGSGLIGYGTNATTMSATGRALVVPTGNYIGIFSDGTAGVGTITLTTLTGSVISIENVTFYGDITKIVATSTKSVIATGSNANTVQAIAYDAAGVTVGAGTLYAYSSDITTVSDSGTSASIVNGVATFALTGVKTGGVALIVKNSTGNVVSAPISTRVEGSATTVKIAFDKSVYAPGEAATISVSVLDALGLPLSAKTYANLFATGGITSSYAFGSGSADLTGVSVTTDTDTVKTYRVFMPLSENTIVLNAKGGTSLPVAGQIIVTVAAEISNAGAKAANKASQDALDAANAATKAADAATKAADASTVQAKAAADAVAQLSLNVTAMIASLKKQITAMTALILKIQKKVKA